MVYSVTLYHDQEAHSRHLVVSGEQKMVIFGPNYSTSTDDYKKLGTPGSMKKNLTV